MKKLISIFLLCATLALSAVLTSCSVNDPDVPDGMKIISTELVKYNLYVPAGWVEDISTGICTARYSDSDASNISVMTLPLDNADITIDDFWAGHKNGFEETFSDIEMLEEGGSMLLGGQAAKRYIYSASVLGMKYRFMQIASIYNGNVYLFTYTSTDELYDSHTEDVDLIIENFSFK